MSAEVVGMEVLIVVVMMSSIIWDKSPCILLKIIVVSEEHMASIFRLKKSQERNRPTSFTLKK
jgi:hypothetical protein